jgi:hypothetical protein
MIVFYQDSHDIQTEICIKFVKNTDFLLNLFNFQGNLFLIIRLKNLYTLDNINRAAKQKNWFL